MDVDRHAGHRIPLHPPKTSSSVPHDDWYPPAGASADRTVPATSLRQARPALGPSSRHAPRSRHAGRLCRRGSSDRDVESGGSLQSNIVAIVTCQATTVGRNARWVGLRGLGYRPDHGQLASSLEGKPPRLGILRALDRVKDQLHRP